MTKVSQKKPEPAWMKWFHRSFLFFLILFGVLHLVSYGKNPRMPVTYMPETRTLADKLVPFDSKTIEAELLKSGKRQTLFFFYASWCPFCQQEFGMVKAVRSRFPEDKLNIVYVSWDQDKLALADFLRKHDPKFDFTFYHNPPEMRDALVATLKNNYGLKPDGSIPYMILFDENGKLKAEHSRQISVTELKTMLSGER